MNFYPQVSVEVKLGRGGAKHAGSEIVGGLFSRFMLVGQFTLYRVDGAIVFGLNLLLLTLSAF